MAGHTELDWLAAELAATQSEPLWRPEGLLLFGSAVLLLHGIRDDVGDVDLFVSREMWGRLAARAWRVRTPRLGDPSLLEWTGGPRTVHAFFAWTSRDPWMDVPGLWEQREWVRGWPCIPVLAVREHKVAAHNKDPLAPQHVKHLRDVELIDAWLEQRAASC